MGICFSIQQDEQRFQERQLLSSHNSSGVSVGLGVLLLAIFIGWLRKVLRKRRIEKLKKKYFKCNGGFLLQEQLSSGEVNVEKVKMFNSNELDKATDHYHVDRMLGQGGQGTVYRGILRNGQIVAVKKLKALDEGNIQQFINEVVILAQINHRNVVRLLGCCLESEVPLLVYEFIPNGNLFQLIHESNEEFTLTWDARLRIAKEVAGALSYLHSAASIPIYHRDIKSTNILLDDKYRAKVADFGTSRFVTIDQTHVTTLVKGTFGYFDPEYFRSSRFTDKSDVYSFGVVLSELLTGRKPIFSMRLGEVQGLAEYFVHAVEENRLFDIIDTQVIGEAKNDEILSVAKLASRCLSWTGKERPTMKEVTMVLEDIHGRSQQGLNFSHSSTKTCTPESSSIKRLSISPIPRSVTNLRQSFGDGNVNIFTYKEMALATKQFRRHYILGEGGFGVVYKGVIDNSVRRGYGTTHVAIKKFNPYGLQGDNEWLAEVNYLSQLSHPNLVKLVGYCCEDEHRLLVYEYIANGSLEMHLYCRIGCPLTWSKRMKIALDAAKGLAFLHGAERSIIHRDFKTSSILLDASFNAKLSNFGLAKDGPMGDQTHVSTRVMGTYGYAAPEYIATGHLTARSDIYGFGVVLLELLLGRKAVDMSRPRVERNLVDWAIPHLNQNKKVLKILDPRMEGQYSSTTAIKVANLAYQCLSHNPKCRPLINQVVDLLETVQSNDKEGLIQNAGKTLYEDATYSPSCLFGKEKTNNEQPFKPIRQSGKKWTWKWKEQK